MNTGRAEVPGPIPKKLYKAVAKLFFSLFLPFLDGVVGSLFPSSLQSPI